MVAKKAPAKKVAVARKMVAAKKVPAKKAPAKKMVVARKMVVAKKAPAKKAAAKRVMARKGSPAGVVARKRGRSPGSSVGAYQFCVTHGLYFPRGESCPRCP